MTISFISIHCIHLGSHFITFGIVLRLITLKMTPLTKCQWLSNSDNHKHSEEHTTEANINASLSGNSEINRYSKSPVEEINPTACHWHQN